MNITNGTPETAKYKAITVPNLFADIKGRKIAYRTIGGGNPIILCNRFRGILDTWDPAFIDELAQHSKVIIFDYSGIGLSTGAASMSTMLTAAQDVKDLAEALQLDKFSIGGWSYGGMVAQFFTVTYPDLIEKTVLLGTTPPASTFPLEEIFYVVASRMINDLDDEYILFFEPTSDKSKAAAALTHNRILARTENRDIPVPEELWSYYNLGSREFFMDQNGTKEKLIGSEKPILVLMGDHDICFPVEAWYSLNRQTENIQLIVLPKAGHGPHHQYPILSAQYINSFLQLA